VIPLSPKPDDPLLPLARAAARGDGRAVRELVTEVGPAVLRVIRRVLGTHDRDAEDVAQEAIFAALGALSSFRAECSVSHFFCRVSALTALNARRRARLRTLIAPDSARAIAIEADTPSPMAVAVAVRRREACRRLLDELPAGQAEVLMLHCVLGYTIAETADTLDIPVNTVRGRLNTAKNSLRERLNGDPDLRELVRGAS
jgi:RNA polymerase sigma-70 factor (ECF subfamily)